MKKKKRNFTEYKKIYFNALTDPKQNSPHFKMRVLLKYKKNKYRF